MNFIEEKILSKNDLDNLCLRFPPENSGYLHLGHIKAMCLNFGLAERYNRPCNLRFDDTNPSNESEEFSENIIHDVSWMGFKPAKIVYASDYFEFLYECALTLIKKNLAYVDDSTSEEITLLKGTTIKPGIDSPFRNRSIEENLMLFEEMKSGLHTEGSKTLRAKIDMSSDNMLLRDPIIYRIMNVTHHHVGDKWKIYPMYDYAHPLSDYLEGISDSLCTLEFEVHRPLYNWFLNNLDFKNSLPEQTEFSRLNIDHTILSKRKLKVLVEEGLVSGWDDPRMPTVSGLRRRGYTPTSLKEFCERVGWTKNNVTISHKLMEECLRTELNKTAIRLMGVFDPIKLTILNWPSDKTESLEIENNPEDPNAGKRTVKFSKHLYIEREDFRKEADKNFFRLKLGGEVRLKGAYIIKAVECVKDDCGNTSEILCELDIDTKSGGTSTKKVKGTIHWVSIENCVRVSVNNYDKLFTAANPESEEDFLKTFNNDSMKKSTAYFEENLKCDIGLILQAVRKGYYRVDENSTESEIVLNSTVTLKDSFKP